MARPVSPHIVILMGVAGSGKTTIGRMVADALGWSFFEADDFHSAANKAKMERSLPLDDADRAPWLASVRAKIDECRAAGRKAIFTCSALKAQYRSRLGTDVPDTLLVHLTGDIRTIETRVARRAGHFMKAEMVRSQFDVLEPPAEALTIDVAWPPAEIVQTILRRINSA